MAKPDDLVGKRFGRLVVISRSESPDFHTRWLCVCDCGTQKIARGATLKNGRTSSCGCYRREHSSLSNKTHGATSGGKFTPEYVSYSRMKDRCLNPNHRQFRDYGGRGIKICDQWTADFSVFLKDMGEKPTQKHTIERIDNDLGYEPNNCKWATRQEQSGTTYDNPEREAEIDALAAEIARPRGC